MSKKENLLEEKLKKLENEIFELKRMIAGLKNPPKYKKGEFVSFMGIGAEIIEVHQYFENQIIDNQYTIQLSVTENELDEEEEI